MIDEMMNLQALLEKSADAELLREMIGFAAQRLMELEVGGATATACGRPGPGRWSSGVQSSGLAATSRAVSSRGGWRRRR